MIGNGIPSNHNSAPFPNPMTLLLLSLTHLALVPKLTHLNRKSSVRRNTQRAASSIFICLVSTGTRRSKGKTQSINELFNGHQPMERTWISRTKAANTVVNKAASKATRNPTNRHRSRAKVASRAAVNGAANVKASSKTDNDGFQPRRKCRGYLLF